jgi:serine/threonine-protein kinase
VYVIDWGVARILKTRRTSSMHAVVDSVSPDATSAGALLGTPGYMAPEQMKGEDVGPAADVFSLGAILFEILAAEPLHPAGRAAIASTLAKPGDSPARRKPERQIAPELDGLCTAALAEEPSARPTARELAERVQSYLDGDRDLEHRRELAAQQLAVAREAYRDPARRVQAAQAASRALALDPESPDAAALVTKMIIEPPETFPPELAKSLEESELELNRQRSRRAAVAFASIYVFLPVFLFVQDVRDWLGLGLLYGSATMMSVIAWRNSQTGTMPPWILMLGNFAFALMFSRLAGSFVLTAALVCGQTLALSTRSEVANRPWILAAWVACALLVPVGLELAGIFESTWTMTPHGLLTKGTILDTTRPIDVVPLAIGQTLLAIVVGWFAMSITRAREEAQRRAYIQAWHLEQLVPRGALRSP